MDAKRNGAATENNNEDFDKNNKKKWLTKIKDFLHVHDLFHIEIGNKQHKKITRYSGNGVTMNSDGNVTSCSENFQAEIEEY
jgi:hypothetical protein